MNNPVKIGIIAAIAIFLVVVGTTLYSEKKEDDKIVKKIERNFKTEDRKIFEDRVIDYKNKLEESKDDGEKYNLYLNLGQTEYTLGNLLESKQYYEEAIKLDSNQYDVYLGLFLTQVDMQDYSGAETSIRKAMSTRKGIADFWRRYIQMKIDRMNSSNEEVNRLYEEAIREVTQNGDAANKTDIYTSYATWLEKAGDPAKAIEYWKKAIEVNPETKSVYQAEIDRILKSLK